MIIVGLVVALTVDSTATAGGYPGEAGERARRRGAIEVVVEFTQIVVAAAVPVRPPVVEIVIDAINTPADSAFNRSALSNWVVFSASGGIRPAVNAQAEPCVAILVHVHARIAALRSVVDIPTHPVHYRFTGDVIVGARVIRALTLPVVARHVSCTAGCAGPILGSGGRALPRHAVVIDPVVDTGAGPGGAGGGAGLIALRAAAVLDLVGGVLHKLAFAVNVHGGRDLAGVIVIRLSRVRGIAEAVPHGHVVGKVIHMCPVAGVAPLQAVVLTAVLAFTALRDDAVRIIGCVRAPTALASPGVPGRGRGALVAASGAGIIAHAEGADIIVRGDAWIRIAALAGPRVGPGGHPRQAGPLRVDVAGAEQAGGVWCAGGPGAGPRVAGAARIGGSPVDAFTDIGVIAQAGDRHAVGFVRAGHRIRAQAAPGGAGDELVGAGVAAVGRVIRGPAHPDKAIVVIGGDGHVRVVAAAGIRVLVPGRIAFGAVAGGGRIAAHAHVAVHIVRGDQRIRVAALTGPRVGVTGRVALVAGALCRPAHAHPVGAGYVVIGTGIHRAQAVPGGYAAGRIGHVLPGPLCAAVILVIGGPAQADHAGGGHAAVDPVAGPRVGAAGGVACITDPLGIAAFGDDAYRLIDDGEINVALAAPACAGRDVLVAAHIAGVGDGPAHADAALHVDPAAAALAGPGVGGARGGPAVAITGDGAAAAPAGPVHDRGAT